MRLSIALLAVAMTATIAVSTSVDNHKKVGKLHIIEAQFSKYVNINPLATPIFICHLANLTEVVNHFNNDSKDVLVS